MMDFGVRADHKVKTKHAKNETFSGVRRDNHIYMN